MWKVSGKKIFPRWQKIRHATAKYKNSKPKERPVALCVVTERSQSNGDQKWKQHAKHQHSFWDDVHFSNNTLCGTLLETVGIVGTAAFCLDFQHRHYRDLHVDENGSPCMFSRLAAYAMPFSAKKESSDQTSTASDARANVSPPKESKKSEKLDVANATEELNSVTMESVAAIENSIGLMFLEQDDKQAYDFFKASAKLGCVKGMYNLGLCYEQGRGTIKNLSKAAKCYEKAASEGHALATYNLAVLTLNGSLADKQDFFCKGIELLMKAAEQNVPEAQLHLGYYYLEENNYEEAYKMFKAAAGNNNLDGIYNLGLCYEEGWGVRKNFAIATEIFAEAARKGHQEATLKLGNCFETANEGIDPDAEFSMTLYRMLADRGHRGGKNALNAKEEFSKTKNGKVDVGRNLTQAEEKPPPSLHNSISVPELRNYSSYCKIDHSKSILLHSMMSLKDKNSVDFSKSTHSLDLAYRKSPVGEISPYLHSGLSLVILASS